jgi:hypothetical protein
MDIWTTLLSIINRSTGSRNTCSSPTKRTAEIQHSTGDRQVPIVAKGSEFVGDKPFFGATLEPLAWKLIERGFL